MAICDAWLAHKVLVFDGPILEPERQLSAARLFGEPDLYLFIKGLDGFPEVIETLKAEKDTVNFGGEWHSDTAYLPGPALGTLLMAVETPDLTLAATPCLQTQLRPMRLCPTA